RRRHTRSNRDWSSDVCSSDLSAGLEAAQRVRDHRAENGLRMSLEAVEAYHRRARSNGVQDSTPVQTTARARQMRKTMASGRTSRSEEHTSELQSRFDLVCRLL